MCSEHCECRCGQGYRFVHSVDDCTKHRLSYSPFLVINTLLIILMHSLILLALPVDLKQGSLLTTVQPLKNAINYNVVVRYSHTPD